MEHTRMRWALAMLVALSAAACSESTSPGGWDTSELTAELAVTPDHLHSYQTTATFTVVVTDPNANPVTDFDVVQVERRAAGTTGSFSVMEAALDGDFYVVEHVFEGSGEFDVRVTGLRPTDTDLVVLYESTTPLHVVKAHADVGGYKVELEPSPAHIHQGNTVTIQFWVLDDTDDSPITGLTPEVFVVEPVGGETAMASTEGAGGLYHADFTFDELGDNDIGIRISAADAADGVGGEWSIPVEVHAAH